MYLSQHSNSQTSAPFLPPWGIEGAINTLFLLYTIFVPYRMYQSTSLFKQPVHLFPVRLHSVKRPALLHHWFYRYTQLP